MNKSTQKLLMGAAIAGMVGIGMTSSTAFGFKCTDNNACKGQSQGCKSAKNKCKGQNSCKNHKFNAKDEKACEAAKANKEGAAPAAPEATDKKE
jgi:hypothetical protein